MPRPKTRKQIAAKAKLELGRERKKDEALRLRIAGLTLREIAKTLGYKSPGAADHAIREARQKLPKQDAAEIRALLADRLEATFKPLMLGAMTGDLKSVDRLVKVTARLSRMLGLDLQAGAPTEVPVGRLRVAIPDEPDDGGDDPD